MLLFLVGNKTYRIKFEEDFDQNISKESIDLLREISSVVLFKGDNLMWVAEKTPTPFRSVSNFSSVRAQYRGRGFQISRLSEHSILKTNHDIFTAVSLFHNIF